MRKREQYAADKNNGLSNSEIAIKYGVTRQAVFAALKPRTISTGKRGRKQLDNVCRYCGDVLTAETQTKYHRRLCKECETYRAMQYKLKTLAPEELHTMLKKYNKIVGLYTDEINQRGVKNAKSD